jgi:site-specific DNA recombinase
MLTQVYYLFMSRPETHAAIYTRISRDIQGQGLGVERQREECQEMASRLGLTVKNTYSDNDISAYSGKHRPDYERLLGDIERGEVSAVLTWSADRLYRRTRELERYIDLCQPRNVKTHTVKAGDLDLTTASGRGNLRILGSVAQLETEARTERIQAQKAQAAKMGKFMGGRVPWGWTIEGGVALPKHVIKGGETIEIESVKGGKVVIDPAAAQFIREGTKAVLEGHGVVEVTRRWADAGARSLSGTRMNTTQVRRVLLRPRNAGIVTYHGVAVSSSWPQIVNVDDFRALEAKLNDRSISPQSAAKFKYLLSGLVRCHCGRYMTGFGAEATPEKPSYRRMYRCRVHQEGGRYVPGHATREMKNLDDFVVGMIAAYMSRPHSLELYRSEALNRASRASSSAPETPNESNDLYRRKDALARLFAEGVIDQAQLAEGTAAIRDQLAAIERRATSRGASAALAALMTQRDPGRAFKGAETAIQREAIGSLADIRILPGAKPGAGFNPDLVEFTWKTAP